MIIFKLVPYLAKSHRPDIHNGPGVIQIVPTFCPQHLLKFNTNNGPSLGHSSLGPDGRYTCSSLPLMIWWVPYLNKGCRPDFNNGPGDNSDSGPVLASWCLFESDSNNGLSQGHSSLVSDEVFRSPAGGFLVVTISGQRPRA